MHSSEDQPLPPASTNMKSFPLGIDLSFLTIHKFIALVASSKFFRAFFRSPNLVCLLGEGSDKVVLGVVRV